ncbi:MAG: hypothetical protein COA78_38340 [Blastopirellula sp.]|nr:MAG: hypothetical protein COA78_38340 [Blastopirellula sp.]
MAYQLSSGSIRNREGVDPRLILVSDYAIKRTVIDFGHPAYGGIRSTEDQQYLFKIGASLADGINDISDHQIGFALDFFPYVNGRTSYKIAHCALVMAAFLEGASRLGIQLGWGGFWGGGPYIEGFTDMPHMYIPKEFR